MLLRSVSLKNIRSYTEQTISFPDGSTLLSGDIGSGKSTLLLAVEFALFGISKPELDGEALLRKGATQGSVELNFHLEGKEIIVQRNLKKTKQGTVQASGHILINNLKKELTPVELKAEVIGLLNYPEEMVSKSKNYIFRYTVYCPQEEMKQILQENPDSRLDLLRKIFSLDKYKRVRDNLYTYLKRIREQSALLKGKSDPLEDKKAELPKSQEEERQLLSSLNILLPQISFSNQKIAAVKLALQDLEEKNRKHLEAKNKLFSLQSLLREKRSQKESLLQKQKQDLERLAQAAVAEPKDKLRAELQELLKKQQDFITKDSELKARISSCQEQVPRLQKEISRLDEQVSSLQEKRQESASLDQELAEKKKISQEKETVEAELDLAKESFSRHKVLLSQSKGTAEKISLLDLCPTCLQQVPQQHKEGIFSQYQKNREESEAKLKDLEQKKSLLQNRFIELNQQLESLLKKERLLAAIKTEINYLLEKQELLADKKGQLQKIVKENNQLIKEMDSFRPEELSEIRERISAKQESLQKIAQREELERSLEDTGRSLADLGQKVKDFSAEEDVLQSLLSEHEDPSEEITKQRAGLEQLLDQEKSLLKEKASLQTKISYSQQQIGRLNKDIEQLNDYRSQLIRLNEIHHWLESFMVRLTYTLEKQVMLRIHHVFNSFFREWFSILIEDENFSARIDDSFTPVIEQNGYGIYFCNLSGGERTAASLSYRLALNKVINDLVHEIKTKDLLILDEPTDGFSSEQLDKIRDIMERLNLRQTIIVSHEDKIESFVDNVIKISKQEGISKVY